MNLAPGTYWVGWWKVVSMPAVFVMIFSFCRVEGISSPTRAFSNCGIWIRKSTLSVGLPWGEQDIYKEMITQPTKVNSWFTKSLMLMIFTFSQLRRQPLFNSQRAKFKKKKTARKISQRLRKHVILFLIVLTENHASYNCYHFVWFAN